MLGGTTFTSAEEIEASTPRRWWRWRAGHSLLLCTLIASDLVFVLPAQLYGQQALLRNGLGLLGLALLSARTVGPQLSWVIPIGYVGAVYFGAGRATTAGRPAWAFVMQPAGTGAATTTAALMLIVGLAAWCAPRRPSRE